MSLLVKESRQARKELRELFTEEMFCASFMEILDTKLEVWKRLENNYQVKSQMKK